MHVYITHTYTSHGPRAPAAAPGSGLPDRAWDRAARAGLRSAPGQPGLRLLRDAWAHVYVVCIHAGIYMYTHVCFYNNNDNILIILCDLVLFLCYSMLSFVASLF